MLKRLLLLSLLPLCSHAEELPAPVKAIEKQGITIIKPFEAPGGMKGWLGKYQDMGVAIYLTPDGKHAISGYMYRRYRAGRRPRPGDRVNYRRLRHRLPCRRHGDDGRQRLLADGD